jgi:glycosyltransferase involved in cell wall biosynthesis
MKRVLIIGNHVPRKCGIATFTEDLADALESAGSEVAVIAMNDREEGYEYPDRVRCTILQERPEDYARAAEFTREYDPDVISLQHEFGIFGGRSGELILDYLERVRVPVVTKLHTVLREPTPEQLSVMKRLDRLSARFMVMSERGRDFLVEIYGIEKSRIDIVHHGIHPLKNTEAADPNLIATFGLLGPDKGIENVISALPAILERNPKARYHIIGATHPNLVATQGESYRESLVELAKDLGVEHALKFTNRFVTRDELLNYLSEATFYITPYNKIQQITSGTLAYAVGTGRVVVSTPYWYAEELLADGRGRLVPPKCPEAIADTICELFENPEERNLIARRAAEFGERMLWSNVAKAYLRSFDRASDMPKLFETVRARIPKIDLRHVISMTDDTGILQHATYSTPNRHEGYCIDDNARALHLITNAFESIDVELASSLSHTYLAFIWHAFDKNRRVFRNFMSYARTWLEREGSEDSQGRTMWALGRTARLNADDNVREVARIIFDSAMPLVEKIRSPRAIAFALMGLIERARMPDAPDSTRSQIVNLKDSILQLFHSHSEARWAWFEPYLTYCNAILPHALLAAGDLMDDEEAVDIAIKSLEWLADYQADHAGKFAPVGSNGFATKEGRAWHDQQPIEAWQSMAAYAEALRVTGDDRWRDHAKAALDWYFGRNRLGISMYDEQTGGCYDGLERDGVNKNQGAESTLSAQLGITEWQQINQKVTKKEFSIVHSA